MRVVDRPRVWLLASTALHQGSLVRALEYQGHDAFQYQAAASGTTSPDALCEAAGRVCYDSFTNRRPGGNKAYLDRIKEQAHGCYDGETEVLTTYGWKFWEHVTENDALATLRPDGTIAYEIPYRLVQFPYKGRMYRVESQQVDLLVTPNHRMYVCPTTTRVGRKKLSYEFITAEDLGHRSHAYLKVGTWRTPNETENPDLYALLGFAIGDGYLRSSGRLVFHLRRERKISWLRHTVGNLGFVMDMEGDNYVVHLPEDVKNTFSQIYTDWGEKCIPSWMLFGLSPRDLEGLYAGLMQADGSHGTGWSFCTTSATLASQFQQLCLHTGRCANQGETYGPDMRPTSYGDKPLYRFHVPERTTRPEVNKYSGCSGKTYWVDGWEGTVYCAEVPNGTLYVRRNGRPVWCGNSVLEHASFSFLVTDVSRGCSHELVRHRAGWAYSQRSTRYVDESEAGVVVPHKVRGDDHARLLWELSCRNALDSYRQIVNALSKGPGESATERKKAIRQAARSVLPTAVVTTLVATANARALRHFFEMRASAGADPEIRQLAVAVYDLVSHYELFADYEKVPLEDGSHALETGWRKV